MALKTKNRSRSRSSKRSKTNYRIRTRSSRKQRKCSKSKGKKSVIKRRKYGGAVPDLAEYIESDPTGKGANATVYQLKDPNKDKVIKVLKDVKQIAHIFESAIKLNSLNSAYFPKFYTYNIEDGKITFDVLSGSPTNYIIMDFINGNNIEELLESKLTLSMKLKIFREICVAVKLLHDNNLFHGDLKPANIMITPASGADLTKEFSFSIVIIDLDCVETQFKEPCSKGLGTPGYMIPFGQIENIKDNGNGNKIELQKYKDIFSLACILLRFLCRIFTEYQTIWEVKEAMNFYYRHLLIGKNKPFFIIDKSNKLKINLNMSQKQIIEKEVTDSKLELNESNNQQIYKLIVYLFSYTKHVSDLFKQSQVKQSTDLVIPTERADEPTAPQSVDDIITYLNTNLHMLMT
jgi:serine/threonine protein kinase